MFKDTCHEKHCKHFETVSIFCLYGHRYSTHHKLVHKWIPDNRVSVFLEYKNNADGMFYALLPVDKSINNVN